VTALPINLWFGAVCGAVLCAFTPVDARAVRRARAAQPGARAPSSVRRQALRVLAAFAALALAPAAAYLQAIFPDWSVLYVLPAGTRLDTPLARVLVPLAAAIAVAVSSLLGWLLAEAASAFVLSRGRGLHRRGDKLDASDHGPEEDGRKGRNDRNARHGRDARNDSGDPDDSQAASGPGLEPRFVAQLFAPIVEQLLGSARAVRGLTAVLLALLGSLLALLVRGRLGLVGTYEQFHADRWLMQPLFSAATKLPFALVLINLGILLSLGLAAHLLRWRSDLLALPLPAPPAHPDHGPSHGPSHGTSHGTSVISPNPSA
jgi:hypothetical protein